MTFASRLSLIRVSHFGTIVSRRTSHKLQANDARRGQVGDGARGSTYSRVHVVKMAASRRLCCEIFDASRLLFRPYRSTFENCAHS